MKPETTDLEDIVRPFPASIAPASENGSLDAETNSGKLTPFLKWAGGKRWFVDRHLDLLPSDYEKYIEPFLGSGAVFFSQNAKSATLSDLNADLIATYKAIRDQPEEVEKELLFHHDCHSSDYYYKQRGSKPAEQIELAAWFLYLNRTCWNGLYRVNKKNQFNVPQGTKSAVSLPTDNFVGISRALQNVDIECCDFASAVAQAQANDFVFVDPPYTVKHNLNGFVKYNDHIFSWSDQIRLRDSIVEASERGAKILVTNADHESVWSLYEGVGSRVALNRATVISGASRGRGTTTELAIKVGY